VPGPGNGPPLGPTGVPLLASLLPSSATVNERSVANHGWELRLTGLEG